MKIPSVPPLKRPGDLDPQIKTPADAPQTNTRPSGPSAQTPGVIYEKSSPGQGIPGNYGKGGAALSEMDRLKLEMDQKMQGAFYLMVQDALQGQNTGMKLAIENLLKNRGEDITPQMRAEAQADIEDGGFFSVEAVTDRIINFAKAVSGDDPSKAGKLREAFEQGFKEAEKVWGDALPEISQKTYDSVMKAFDDWENPPSEQ